MTDDKGNDWDNRRGVGGKLSQKEHYYNYYCYCADPNEVLHVY